MPGEAGVRSLFSRIACDYDRTNRCLSFALDQHWRNKMVRGLPKLIQKLPPQGRENLRILDLCSGTGEIALAAARTLGKKAGLTAMDFSMPMLRQAQQKRKLLLGEQSQRLQLIEGDCLNLPFRDRSFQIITIAFGLRNLIDPIQGLCEIRRVLQPGGWACILEFSPPAPGWRASLLTPYWRALLPRLGRLMTGSNAFDYFVESVQRFPQPEQITNWFVDSGLEPGPFQRLLGEMAVLYTLSRPKGI